MFVHSKCFAQEKLQLSLVYKPVLQNRTKKNYSRRHAFVSDYLLIVYTEINLSYNNHSPATNAEMNYDLSVMGPGKGHCAHVLLPQLSVSPTYKLRWREDVYDWMGTIHACANGSDERAKGMYAPLEMISFSVLLLSRQQLLEKAIKWKIISYYWIF